MTPRFSARLYRFTLVLAFCNWVNLVRLTFVSDLSTPRFLLSLVSLFVALLGFFLLFYTRPQASKADFPGKTQPKTKAP